jgi:Zn-dependent M28 family amino/carboxypeptidase
LLLLAGACWGQSFSGQRAYQDTAALVKLGARTPGSLASKKARTYIQEQVLKSGWQAEEFRFTAATPRGPVKMTNLVACRNVSVMNQLVVFSGHYDTKVFPGAKFVGANDGGSSAGFLVELARALPLRSTRLGVCLVWFDGEEAYQEWTETDSLYGSRALAEAWQREGRLRRIRALINVDMVGDKDLGILREYESNTALKNLIWSSARAVGAGGAFLNQESAVTDDHVPFLRRGVPAVNLIDFEYGPYNRHWHTDEDTMDKLSPKSFETVGKVLLEVWFRLLQS